MGMINALLLTKGIILESETTRAAQNVANDSNSGFRERKNLKISEYMLATNFPNIGATYLNKSAGSIEFTERSWDLYLKGQGEFGFLMDEGKVSYRREGGLRIDEAGLLTSKFDGRRVIDVSGQEIRLARSVDYRVLGDGRVLDDNNNQVAQIGVFDRSTGERMTDARFGQGGVETSNTNAIEQYTNLIGVRNQYSSIKNWIEIEDQRQKGFVKEIFER